MIWTSFIVDNGSRRTPRPRQQRRRHAAPPPRLSELLHRSQHNGLPRAPVPEVLALVDVTQADFYGDGGAGGGEPVEGVVRTEVHVGFGAAGAEVEFQLHAVEDSLRPHDFDFVRGGEAEGEFGLGLGFDGLGLDGAFDAQVGADGALVAGSLLHHIANVSEDAAHDAIRDSSRRGRRREAEPGDGTGEALAVERMVDSLRDGVRGGLKGAAVGLQGIDRVIDIQADRCGLGGIER